MAIATSPVQINLAKLNLPITATWKEVRPQRNKLAQIYHTDKSTGIIEIIQTINQAYDELSLAHQRGELL